MSFDQINTFLKCFNNVVREKFADPSRTEPSPHLIENLRRACQFDRPGAVDADVLEVFSAAKYKNDEVFWFKELAGHSTSEVSPVRPRTVTPDDWSASRAETFTDSLLQSLSQIYGVTRSSVLIGAYVVALWHTTSRREYTIVAVVDDKEAFPVRLNVSSESAFADIVQSAQSKIEAGKQHRVFALRVLINMIQTPSGVRRQPHFDGGYLEGGEMDGAKRFSRFSVAPYGGLDLLLNVIEDSEKYELRMYSSARPADHSVERVSANLMNVLTAAKENPEVRLHEIKSFQRPSGDMKPQGQLPQFAF